MHGVAMKPDPLLALALALIFLSIGMLVAAWY
jgi:hypothetical protein